MVSEEGERILCYHEYLFYRTEYESYLEEYYFEDDLKGSKGSDSINWKKEGF